MVSIMQAMVVDLPLPVGPVTRTSPLCFRLSSRRIGGSPSCSNVRNLVRDRPQGRSDAPALPVDVHAEPPDSLDPVGEVQLVRLLERSEPGRWSGYRISAAEYRSGESGS